MKEVKRKQGQKQKYNYIPTHICKEDCFQLQGVCNALGICVFPSTLTDLGGRKEN